MSDILAAAATTSKNGLSINEPAMIKLLARGRGIGEDITIPYNGRHQINEADIMQPHPAIHGAGQAAIEKPS